MKFFYLLSLLSISSLCFGQTAITSYQTTNATSAASTIAGRAGHISAAAAFTTNNFLDSRTYNLNFGTSYPAVAATTKVATGYTVGADVYSAIPASSTQPFNVLRINRINNLAYTGDYFSGFFTYSSLRDGANALNYNPSVTNGTTLYIDNTFRSDMSSLLNNFTLNYGGDNVFSNLGTGNAGTQTNALFTGNNIERIDLVYSPGIGATTTTALTKVGFLVNERNGNDLFKVAAITSIDGSGNVTGLGTVLTVGAAAWGKVGDNIPTVVFSGVEGAATIKPKELVSMSGVTVAPYVTQQVSGTYISLTNLGIPINTKIYGIALFPGDITANFLTLTGTPTTTPETGNGGMDLMSGNMLARSTFDLLAQTITGKIWNDLDGDGIDDGAAEANVSGTNTSASGSITAGSNLYVNIVDATSGNIIAVVPVNADGTYFYTGALPNFGYRLALSSTPGTVGTPATTSTPTGWDNTEDNLNSVIDPGPNKGLIGLTTPFGTDVVNHDFGIQQLPESAVNSQVIGVNPGGTVNTTVNPNWFQTSNVGVNPNTQDYNSGTVENIRITTFPTNATSITVGTTTYYANAGAIPGTCPTATCLAWPGAGVTIVAPGGVPAQTITVDPVDGLVNAVFSFVAIDNAGKEDPTPGSITMVYSSTLPLKLISFSGKLKDNEVQLHWVVINDLDVNSYVVERSWNAVNFVSIGTKLADNNNPSNEKTYTYDDNILAFTHPVVYYRIKQFDNDGKFYYSSIIAVKLKTNKNSFSLFPNPVKENLFVNITSSTNEVAVVSVYNTAGQIILTQKNGLTSGNNSFNIENVNTLIKGTYILNIKLSNLTITEKFNKQ
jgi:hypothetical protein